ncbi:hypothetical protein KFK09_022339 [Dendrobium nobile]|uniref:Uncharacterized protein n=1 Tax=Dendrobium nobile TaxID=94219 RepID=A0A8T3AJU5_DENNO|nr:hypothetical protein KFK09_022339 [Dendrobium nobile]
MAAREGQGPAKACDRRRRSVRERCCRPWGRAKRREASERGALPGASHTIERGRWGL